MTLRELSLFALSLTAATTLAAQTPGRADPLTQLSDAVRTLTERVSPAVVEIVVNGYGTEDEGRVADQVSRREASGSGVIVDPSGYIVTNAHVVQGAVDVKVLPPAKGGNEPGGRLRPAPVAARVIGVDRESDLALLKIDAANLPVLHFGDSDRLRKGDLVLAIGSPLGLQNSVSMGVVSAPARAVSDDNTILYIQTDASINPGNSGGALVDHTGALMGINSFIMTQSGGNEGIGFAIPSDVVLNVYRQLRAKGHVSRGSVEAYVQDITPVMARGLALPASRGVIVADVDPNGPAAKGGLRRRDILLAMNGREMDSARQFAADINRRPKGSKIELLVQRGDDRVPLELVVQEESEQWDPLADMADPAKNLVPRLGILCIQIDKRVQDLLPDLRRPYGLIVAAKSPDGQAQFIDLQPGDVIHSLNGVPVAFLDVFQKMIDELHHGDPVVLEIEREGRYQFIAFEIE